MVWQSLNPVSEIFRFFFQLGKDFLICCCLARQESDAQDSQFSWSLKKLNEPTSRSLASASWASVTNPRDCIDFRRCCWIEMTKRRSRTWIDAAAAACPAPASSDQLADLQPAAVVVVEPLLKPVATTYGDGQRQSVDESLAKIWFQSPGNGCYFDSTDSSGSWLSYTDLSFKKKQ